MRPSVVRAVVIGVLPFLSWYYVQLFTMQQLQSGLSQKEKALSSPSPGRLRSWRLFFESAGELVQNLNEQAMQLEKSPGDVESARSLRRTVHTLKGDSAACGFRELSELAHEFENVLTLENPAATPLVPDVALRAADVFTALLEAYRRNKKVPNADSLRAEIEAARRLLETLCASDPPAARKESGCRGGPAPASR